MKNLIYCIIPNWNGKEVIVKSIESLLDQSHPCHIVVVDNGSTDGSAELISKLFPSVKLLKQSRNLGFAEGVNVGIRYALRNNASAIALLNNDAVADKHWLGHLVKALEKSNVGIATCKFVDADNKYIDSTGDWFTSWGLPFPRGRGETVNAKYDNSNWVFGASGGASLYRAEMLKQIGLFDKTFFAYYEDADISWRAQLAGWKVYFEPKAVAYHAIGATSSKIKGFSTYQSIKNLPMVVWKNVPRKLLPIIIPRFYLAYWLFIMRAISRGQFWFAAKGLLASIWYVPPVVIKRWHIQRNRTVTVEYIKSLLVWDLPPNAHALRKLRRALKPTRRAL